MRIGLKRTWVRVALAAAGVWLHASFPAFAQLSDTPREETWVTNGIVQAIVRSGDTVYIGGSFTYVGPNTGGGVPIDAGTGRAVGSFPKVNGKVGACVSDGIGGWFIGGHFTSVAGVARNNIARILSNGTVDAAWNPDAMDRYGGAASVEALALSGSTVYAGGGFTDIGGKTRYHIVALDAATGAATDWNPHADGIVYAMALAGSTVYVGGGFTTIGGQARHNIAALDAETGAATAWNPNAKGTGLCSVYVLALSGSTVYAGGTFTGIGGQTRNNIAALDAATGAATDWNPAAGGYAYPAVVTLAVSGSKVYAGGYFTSIGGQARNNIAALDAETGAATAWNPNANSEVDALAVSGSTLYAGGGFTSIGGQARNYIAALDAATGTATAWDPNANDWVTALAVSDSTVYAGGSLTSIGGKWRNSIAALDAATGSATDWNPNAQGEQNADVLALAVSGSTVYAGGYFTGIGGQARHYIAALDAETGTASAWNAGADGPVDVLAISGSTVYTAGRFTNIGGQERHYVAALDAATGAATAWNPNADNSVWALAPVGSMVYTGGLFTRIGGQPRNRIAALDAETGAATAWNPNAELGLRVGVYALALSGSTVYAGGEFKSIGGQPRNCIAALDSETGAATDWDPSADAEIFALAVSGSMVYAGGDFGHISGQPRHYIAALDAATGAATAWNPYAYGLYYGVIALTISGSTVYAGGEFSTVGGNLRPSFAEFGPAPGPPNLRTVTDNLDGTSHMTWANPYPAPAQFLGFAWDIYARYWVVRGLNGWIWFPYPPEATEGDIDLGYSGAYHAWISSQYPDGSWYPCPNPWTGLQLGGTPHTPMDVWVEDLGDRRVRLHWRPDPSGTWHWQIIAWYEGGGFIPVDGPSGAALWHLIDYGGTAFAPGQADFFAGWADLTLPSDGAYWLFLRGTSWCPPYDPPTTGDYGAAFVYVLNGA
ncbi:MAG: hypothetical protein NTW86_27940 [Candidatus Sumerlaeota bacterium]|nr:hypothetical protein [Candidatus Sumerlaeota bacterium]